MVHAHLSHVERHTVLRDILCYILYVMSGEMQHLCNLQALWHSERGEEGTGRVRGGGGGGEEEGMGDSENDTGMRTQATRTE